MLNWECAYAQLKFARPHLKRAHPLLRCVYVGVGMKRAHAHLKACVCSTGCVHMLNCNMHMLN